MTLHSRETPIIFTGCFKCSKQAKVLVLPNYAATDWFDGDACNTKPAAGTIATQLSCTALGTCVPTHSWKVADIRALLRNV